MPRPTDPYSDIAESVIDHARSIARLVTHAPGDGPFRSAVDEHVRTMRVLAAEHVDPQPDRRFLKALAALAGDGVFVRYEDGVILVIVDNPHEQQRFELVSPAQAARRAEFGDPTWR